MNNVYAWEGEPPGEPKIVGRQRIAGTFQPVPRIRSSFALFMFLLTLRGSDGASPSR